MWQTNVASPLSAFSFPLAAVLAAAFGAFFGKTLSSTSRIEVNLSAGWKKADWGVEYVEECMQRTVPKHPHQIWRMAYDGTSYGDNMSAKAEGTPAGMTQLSQFLGSEASEQNQRNEDKRTPKKNYKHGRFCMTQGMFFFPMLRAQLLHHLHQGSSFGGSANC